MNRPSQAKPEVLVDVQSGDAIQGFRLLEGYFDHGAQLQLVGDVYNIIAAAPLFTPTMPRSGKPFSVRMTNAGPLGWVSDADGYRYQPVHPETGAPWPPIPETLLRLWRDVAEASCEPEACLVNYYANGAKLGSHKDADEEDLRAPVVSISLGNEAVFNSGGLKRSDRKVRMTLASGDVVVLGGLSRNAYHGVDRIKPGVNDVLQGAGRFNLTLRRVSIMEV